ncbi:MAG: membrane protein insertase YidC [Flavobacteriaceae bacterium]|nr:MAG: membrane protein insertase YidC [Flavobacteriaceae bacterium]
MEQKKFDLNSFIGMLLIGAILLWYFNSQTPKTTPVQTNTEVVKDSIQPATTTNISNIPTKSTENDSLKKLAVQNKLGFFATSAINGKEGTTTIENDLLLLKIDNKGGQITEALIKGYQTYDSLPLHMIKDKNATFNINFGTTDNRILNTKDLFFEPTLTTNGNRRILSMKLKASENQFLEYRYEMSSDDYMVNFAIRTQGLYDVINSSNPINLEWVLNGYRHEKSLRTENTMYSCYYFKTEDEVDYMSAGKNDLINDVDWIAYKQHFFSSVLLSAKPFNNAAIASENLAKDDNSDAVFTKKYSLKTPLELSNGELNYELKWYYGPTNYKTLKAYKGTHLSEITDLGWGVFGTINRLVFIPIFGMLEGLIGNYGFIIILMTIVVRILMSPLVYKSYVSSAKMKVIRPELNEVAKKYPGRENAMKRQQETMAIQRKAGVNMMSGCIPALLQMPVFFALFKFFPSNLALRGKSFLWADDLSSYDTIFNLPFNIPFYGNHVSLFPILASIAIFFYMKMNQSQQMNMQAPAQEGMPDMSKLMKYMIYFSPVMMLFFFNNYASSLSLYYFVSNLLTIIIMIVIKNYVIDEDKIHAQIEENKKRPEKKKSKFRQRLDDAMKQAQKQQAKRK